MKQVWPVDNLKCKGGQTDELAKPCIFDFGVGVACRLGSHGAGTGDEAGDPDHDLGRPGGEVGSVAAISGAEV